MKEKEKNITTVKIDLNNLPPFTSEQQATMETLAARPDSEIDYSDIPPPDRCRSGALLQAGKRNDHRSHRRRYLALAAFPGERVPDAH